MVKKDKHPEEINDRFEEIEEKIYNLSKGLKKQSDGEFWADKIMNIATVAIAVLVFEQVQDPKIRFDLILFGLGAFSLLSAIAVYLKGGEFYVRNK